MEGCAAMVVVFGVFMLFGWLFFDENDWGEVRDNEESAT